MTFEYHSQSKLVFGAGALSNLEALLRERRATSVLLVYSGDYVFDLGIRDHIVETVRSIGATLIENGDVVPNPRIELVRGLVAQAREHQVDVVLAVGGASAFDTAKAVGVGVPYAGDVWDLFDGTAEPTETLTVGVVSTIPGSGSEVSDCAVLQQGQDKRALENRILIPSFAIVDPEYSRTAPYRYQAAAVADLAVGFLEPYFTAKPHIEAADRLLEGGFKAALAAGRRFARDPQDSAVRAELHWLSATMFNHCWLATGSENDWTTHRVEHELGGEFDVIHGEGICAILPSIIRHVAERRPERYAQLAVRVFGADPYDLTPREAANVLADELEDFFKTLRLPVSLRQIGVPREAIGHIADQLTHAGETTVGNYSPLSRQDVVAVLERAY
ncbi:iron-containing alcohol dehydrogenase [Bifidobacterium eulemuris]|uniref:BdhA NADH-dependent butanol dehydrogenase n=1 Tax=Bifidobacterium eulemuris TaxID=1765219 RepID=A0A261G7C0_9BIFI|nr:iron-containing alcohol dehydrogenase [Bifidobacterium eulemuris]OZG67304.1 bdhA NADH-dependent butanol dehydrogenase [Bifidobacterium eulemuris]QOL32887.1 iron-containing alcohol dehydrogenase [Bifidobacterium eulemuris]